jgi:hypothetical protein
MIFNVSITLTLSHELNVASEQPIAAGAYQWTDTYETRVIREYQNSLI